MSTLYDVASDDRDELHRRRTGSPGGVLVAEQPLQPVIQLLTQGLNMHATRLDALARALARVERGAAQQAEAAELARAEAERRAAEAYARAEAAEAHADARVQQAEARAAAAHEALERRLNDLEARLDVVPPALEELRSRSAEHELARGAHERELGLRAAEIAEGREAHAQLRTQVGLCAEASALVAHEAATHAAHAELRETLLESSQRQRRHEMQTGALQESLGQHGQLLTEHQAALSGLQQAATEAAGEAETTRAQVRDLAAEHKQLEVAQAQTADTVQLGLARAVASAEAMRDDSEKISSALAELEGWSRRLERLEVRRRPPP